MKIGYIRVSTAEQNTIRQEVLVESLSVDEVYIDRISGKHTNRPELQKMMDYVRHGDAVIVESMGKYTGRKSLVCPDFEKVTTKWRKGELTAVEVMKRLGMSKTSFYRRVQ